MGLFRFIFFGRELLCFLYLDICFLRFGRFSAIISSSVFNPLFSSPEILLCTDWHTLYYPIGLIYCFHFFFILSFCLLLLLGDFHCSTFQIIYSFSVSFSLLFIAFNLALISANEFSSFSWFLFIVTCYRDLHFCW